MLTPEPGLRARLQAHTGLIVVCYCAAWCDTCRAYEPDFTRLAGQWPQHCFLWVDIEDHPALLGDDDVEDFPTVLVQSPQGNLFFGPLQPHIAHLERLVKSLEGGAQTIDGGPPPLAGLLPAGD